MQLIPPWAPNVHPLTVHFPIVLVLLAALVDLVQLVRPRAEARRLAVTLYVLGAVSSGVSFLSGRAAESMVFLPGMAQPLVADHQRWAFITTTFLATLAALRLTTHVAGRGHSRADRTLFAALALVAAILVKQTAERGARLVYEQGVGVVTGPAARSSSTDDRSPDVDPRQQE